MGKYFLSAQLKKKKNYLSCQLSKGESLDSFTTNLKTKLGEKKTATNSYTVDLWKHCIITALTQQIVLQSVLKYLALGKGSGNWSSKYYGFYDQALILCL